MIDLRSDTVTRPSGKMRDAMYSAEVGDDVYGDDPSVNELEAVAADLLGMESAMFLPSGTQANLVAMLTHCARGDEYIVGADAHTYKYEGGGAAVLGGIQPQPVDFDAEGKLPLNVVESVIKEDDFHFARSKLLCLENTQHGRVIPLDYLAEARTFCQRKKLILHLDGARVFNAAVALNVPVQHISQHFDSISVCLSKGLGAPVGSLLSGERGFIDEARRWRKMVGGGMRQAGLLAAAGLVALTDGAQRLSQDHDNAALLAQLLDDIDGIEVKHDWTQTNMVWVSFSQPAGHALAVYAADKGLLISPDHHGGCRFVTHADISKEDIVSCATVLRGFFN